MIRVEYNDIIPQGKEDISEMTASDCYEAVSDMSLLINEGNKSKNIATLEHNLWKLDGSFDCLVPDTQPMWSNQVSSDEETNGHYYFSTPITILRQFANKHTSVGVTLTFGSSEDFCNYVNIKWYNDDEIVADVDFEPNSTRYYCEQNVEIFNKIIITFYSTNKPNRFLKLYAIDDGVFRIFTNKNMRSASILEEMSLISEELPINTFDFSLESTDATEYIFQKKQPLTVYLDDDIIGTFFINESDRISRNLYDISAQDFKGILDTVKFYGGVYFNALAGDIIAKIMSGEKFKYTVDEETANTVLSGYLPISSKRDALAQVLFACCSVCDSSRGETLRIFKLSSEVINIEDSRIYQGGRISTSDITTSIKVAAHKYVSASAADSIFSGDLTQGVNYIEFSAPVNVSKAISVSNSKVAINEVHTNYCIVTASENLTEVTISAYSYIDNITYKTKSNDQKLAGVAANEIEVSEATLISLSNIDAVLDNVFNHYMKNQTLECDMRIESEKCGDIVAMQTEWSGKKVGAIELFEYDIRRNKIGRAVQRIG